MYSFPELIRKIRTAADLTQAEFALAIGVSPILVSMVESGQKDVSKKLLRKIADALEVHPASITPFLYGDEEMANNNPSAMEKQFLSWGIRLQDYLIKNRSKVLRKNAER